MQMPVKDGVSGARWDSNPGEPDPFSCLSSLGRCWWAGMGSRAGGDVSFPPQQSAPCLSFPQEEELTRSITFFQEGALLGHSTCEGWGLSALN